MAPLTPTIASKLAWLLVIFCIPSVLGQTTICQKQDGNKSACGPGNDLCHYPGYRFDAPQYHIRDQSCGMNDPAALAYDPMHGMYHNHWEAHLARPGGGYVRGHAISRDFVHWTHLPVSLWNDRPYDNYAIFTGSATVVNGQVVQVYPGLCKPVGGPCPGGTNLAIAVPADPADPTQTNWTKDGSGGGGLTGYVNPVANNTQRDPSTAWRTPDGEWRLTTYETLIYGSMDFKTWYRIGPMKDFPVGECPSFFALPKLYPGSRPASAGTPTPTHVHKASYNGKDWIMVGTYEPGPIGTTGSFVATRGVSREPMLIDSGAFYASKDFYDPVKQRRILFGWAKIAYGKWNTGNPWDSSCHTLPREITWHPSLQQLVFSPVEEQSSLRDGMIGQLSRQTLTAGSVASLMLKPQSGNQSELLVHFERPDFAVNLTVTVMAESAQKTGTRFSIHYVPPTEPAADYYVVHTTGGPLRLSQADTTLSLHVFTDNVLSEAFWMDGRVAMTVASRCSAECGITVSADVAGVVLSSATAWRVSSPWVTLEEVLQTPRLDKGDAFLMAQRIDIEQSVIKQS